MPATLSVLPNPYAAIDAAGRPSGVVAMVTEAGDHVPLRWVGADLDREQTRKLAPDDKSGRVSTPQETVWSFSAAAVTVPDDVQGYYRHAVRTGDLIAADAATAKRCGVESFGPAASAAAKAAGIAAYEAHYGVGSFPNPTTPPAPEPEAAPPSRARRA